MQKVGYECRVMGVPKTIDNDLFGTDHCPGFASRCQIYRHLLSWRLPATPTCMTPA